MTPITSQTGVTGDMPRPTCPPPTEPLNLQPELGTLRAAFTTASKTGAKWGRATGGR